MRVSEFPCRRGLPKMPRTFISHLLEVISNSMGNRGEMSSREVFGVVNFWFAPYLRGGWPLLPTGYFVSRGSIFSLSPRFWGEREFYRVYAQFLSFLLFVGNA
jgi:hypothetical protein